MKTTIVGIDFLKQALAVLLLLGSAWPPPVLSDDGTANDETVNDGPARRNIIFILTDDQRYDEIGLLNPLLDTPNLDRLARGLASVINILDPDAIVLGGGLSEIGVLYEEVPVRWRHYVFSDGVDTKLLPPKHGAASGVRGAAWLWPLDETAP